MTTEADPTKVMTEEEFITDALTTFMKGWVPLRVYLRMFPDESKKAIEGRVARGQWQRRVHYFAPHGSGAWVCLPAIQKWASGEDTPDDELPT